MGQRLLICLLFLSGYGTVFGQLSVSGTLLDEATELPLSGIHIRTSYPDQTITDEYGRFTVLHTLSNDITFIFELNGESTEYSTHIMEAKSTDLGNITVNLNQLRGQERELPTITLNEDDYSEDANVSGLLQSGDDLFAINTNYTFSPARFRRRGLEALYSDGYLNQLPINDLESGGVYWSNWGGLNDVMRQDAEIIGAEMTEWGFGGIGSTFNTDLRASSQWQQTRFSYAVTNRNYRNRLMGTWSTGLLSSGWAFSVSASRRWAQEGFIEGTFYDAWSYFVSIDKKFNERHALNLVALGAPYQRGGSSSSVQEMYDLADNHYYNSFWGYQQGEKRSGRIYGGHQPLFMLRHDFDINDQWKLTTVLGYQTGKSSVQALEWLDANDPRPDYYRRLPSYVDDPDLAREMEMYLTENEEARQIQWNKLYEVNLNSDFTVNNVDGIEGNTHTGALSRYIMEDRRNDLERMSGNVVLQFLPGSKSRFSAGLTVVVQNSHVYKEVADLLGGEFYIDWDKYAATDFPGDEDAKQNDLLRPNRLVYEEDQFGYDYYARIRQQSGWISYELNSNHWEFALAGMVKNHTYWREGLTQVGKFPDNSYGESAKNDFFLTSGKGLLRYKINGRNYVTLSGMIGEMAPTFRNVFVSPRTRDNVVSGIEKEAIQLGELRYDFRAPYFKMSLSGYYLTTKNGIESTSFYHDDENTFVNFSLTGVDKEYKGIEAAAEYTLFAGFSLAAAAAVGQHLYTSRPNATVTQDNDGTVLLENITVYAKNYYVSGTPQSAYTAGLTYRSKKFWTLYLNVNHFADQWIEFNPLRRTTAAIELVEYQSEQWNDILKQEKIDGTWTVDISFYKSWLVDWPKGDTYFALNIGITNLLDNQDYINGGYEQYRFDYENKDVSTFPSRYSYMQGLNYFVQGSMRF